MAKPKKNEAVRPLPGLAAWVGGKRHLAGRLAKRIAAVEHHCYAEPFVGMGGVFFRRAARARSEAINDRHGDVANLFRVVQRHPDALAAALSGMLASRVDFERQRRIDPDTLTDIDRAARFFFLQKLAFAGKPGGTFGISPAGPSRFSARRAAAILAAAHARLDRVHIDCLPYQDFIARWDRPKTLFYLDPPYWGVESYYGRGLFERPDFERLADQLRRIRGRFILSINDVPEIREMFAWARIEEEPVNYTVSGTKAVMELVISDR